MDDARCALLAVGVPLVAQTARRMAASLWEQPAESDLAWLGMRTLHDAALRHDPERADFAPYLIGRLRWAMISDSRRRARRAKLLASSRPATTAVFVQIGPRVLLPERGAEPFEEEEPREPEAVAETCPEQAYEWQLFRAELRTALGELPPKTRLVMVRHYFGGERLDTLAEELGISKASVTRLHVSGKRKLAARLGRKWPLPWLSGSGGARSSARG
jgi:RNA polymerase sigma factor (sigma-70 family)